MDKESQYANLLLYHHIPILEPDTWGNSLKQPKYKVYSIKAPNTVVWTIEWLLHDLNEHILQKNENHYLKKKKNSLFTRLMQGSTCCCFSHGRSQIQYTMKNLFVKYTVLLLYYYLILVTKFEYLSSFRRFHGNRDTSIPSISQRSSRRLFPSKVSPNSTNLKGSQEKISRGPLLSENPMRGR